MRRIQRVIVGHRSLQEVKLDEAGHVAEIGLPGRPDRLERLFRAGLHLKSVHRDKHSKSPVVGRRGQVEPVGWFGEAGNAPKPRWGHQRGLAAVNIETSVCSIYAPPK